MNAGQGVRERRTPYHSVKHIYTETDDEYQHDFIRGWFDRTTTIHALTSYGHLGVWMPEVFFKYYIYAHFNSAGELFYIGKGSGNRAYVKYGRNKCWYAHAKHGFSVEILFDGLSNMKALIL